MVILFSLLSFFYSSQSMELQTRPEILKNYIKDILHEIPAPLLSNDTLDALEREIDFSASGDANSYNYDYLQNALEIGLIPLEDRVNLEQLESLRTLHLRTAHSTSRNAGPSWDEAKWSRWHRKLHISALIATCSGVIPGLVPLSIYPLMQLGETVSTYARNLGCSRYSSILLFFCNVNSYCLNFENTLPFCLANEPEYPKYFYWITLSTLTGPVLAIVMEALNLGSYIFRQSCHYLKHQQIPQALDQHWQIWIENARNALSKDARLLNEFKILLPNFSEEGLLSLMTYILYYQVTSNL